MPLAPIFAGMRATAALLASLAPFAAVKQTDQQVVSSTVLVGDNTLIMPLVANAEYFFICYLDYEGGTLNASDLQFTWSTPSGTTVRYACLNHDLSNVLQFETRQGSGTIIAGSNGASNLRSVLMAGTVFVSSTSGNMTLQWAQNTSNGTPTIIHAQSILAGWRTS